MWKKLRILMLLLVLLVVALNAYRDQHQDWDQPIIVLLHPINADGRSQTQHYIQQLNAGDFKALQDYLKQMSAAYRGQPISIYFQLGRELGQVPPKVPEQASIVDSMLWSLKFRYYAWKSHQSSDGASTVTLYLNYYDPVLTHELKHSTALQKGRIGSVNVFASSKQAEQNKVVVVHELLHAFGASDKYDLTTGQPMYPLGYADPQQQPIFPQTKAELMAGYIPISQTQHKMPESIDQTVINSLTATEIGWIK